MLQLMSLMRCIERSARVSVLIVSAIQVSEWAGTCLKVSVWKEGTLGAEYERQSAEVARRWKNSGWLHQNSLREKVSRQHHGTLPQGRCKQYNGMIIIVPMPSAIYS